ncbi:MAG: type IV toxin-antitoxin system AbiEi family antitoxin domain-containing protein [Actinomycetota bacterium]|nr:type IV toxin-antitoxin system AbiEi family antitoxin domain-containing protein [Actinomycetota bacterium]
MGAPDECCARVAARQHGCVVLGQALACGLSREGVLRRHRSGRWRRVLPGVYVINGAPDTWEQRLFAAALWGGEGVAVSGRSAATLWGFPGFRRGPVEISLPRARRRRSGLVVHRASLERIDVTSLDGLPVTTAARTLADVAARIDARSFDAAFHHCLHEKLTDLATLRELAVRLSGPGFAGIGRLREALGAYAADARPAASPLEARCARMLAKSRLPAPRRQHEVRIGGRRRRVDFAWPAARVALEVDGYRWHSSRGAWESDRERLRDLRRAGWTVIQATHDDLERDFRRLEEELAALVAP